MERARRALDSHRTHLSLEKDAPDSRSVVPPELGNVTAFPKVASLHSTRCLSSSGCHELRHRVAPFRLTWCRSPPIRHHRITRAQPFCSRTVRESHDLALIRQKKYEMPARLADRSRPSRHLYSPPPSTGKARRRFFAGFERPKRPEQKRSLSARYCENPHVRV